jgi:hypothetical protein
MRETMRVMAPSREQFAADQHAADLVGAAPIS